MTNRSQKSGRRTAICHWSLVIGHWSFCQISFAAPGSWVVSKSMVVQELLGIEKGPQGVLQAFLPAPRFRHSFKDRRRLLRRWMPAERGQIQVLHNLFVRPARLQEPSQHAALVANLGIQGLSPDQVKQ